MKKLIYTFFLLSTLALCGNVWGQTTIAFQDFESGTPEWTYTENPSSFNTGSDIWDIVSGEWKVQDLNCSNGTSGWGTLTFSSIDISSYSNVSLSFDYNIDGYDSGDDVKYQLFLDGVGQSEVLLVDGSSNLYVDGTKTININDAVDFVYIVLSVKQNGDDYGYFDNIKITGTIATPDPEPTNHALSFTATANGSSQIDLNWSDNDGAQAANGFLIVGKTGAASFFSPADGTEPVDDTDWSDNEFEVKVVHGTQTYSVTGLNPSTQYFFEIYPYTNSGANINFKTDGTIPADNATTASIPPVISNIIHSPVIPTNSDPVSVNADVTDTDGLFGVELHWGTTSGSLSNTISMSNTSGDTYTTDTDIPVQTAGTTVYYEIYALDNNVDETTSSEQSYTVIAPPTTTIPYTQEFDVSLEDCSTYNASGATKEWIYSSGVAQMNGYNSGDTEEDWLIIPGINFDNYSGETMTFATEYNYGSDDANNYLKLLYSSDYVGFGDPSFATWTELSYTQPTGANTETASGEIDLSSITGTNVYIAFKYHYEDGNYRSWTVDNILIEEVVSSPTLVVIPTTLTGFTYVIGGGPSAFQSFDLSGTDLDGTSITVSAPTNFEVCLTSEGTYTASVNVGYTAPTLSATTIYVKLKTSLAINTYSGNITINDNGTASNITVSIDGEVTAPDPCAAAKTIPYTQNFDSDDCWSVTGSWEIGTLTGDPDAPSTGHSGNTVAGTDFNANYANNIDIYLTSPVFDLSGTTTPILSFWMDLETESNWDGGTVQIKINSGSWITIDQGDTGFGGSTPNDSDVDGLQDSEDGWSGNLPAAGEWTEVTIDLFNLTTTGLSTISSSDDIEVRFWFGSDGSTGANGWFIDDFSITEAQPTITLSELNLAGFSYAEGSGPSAEQSFTIEGSNLTADISIVPPANYEISTGTGGSFVAISPITLSQTDGSVSTTTIYVRLKEGLAEAIYNNEDITISTTGATDHDVNCNGEVTELSSVINLAYQGFEIDPATPADTWTYSGTCEESTTKSYSGTQSGRLTSSNIVTLENIDITAYDNVILSVAFASSGVDSGDDLFLEISYDNGSTWTGAGSEKLVDGYSNANLDFGDTNGANPTTVATNPWIVNVDNAESQISVRLRANDLESSEYYYIDEIKLSGELSGPTILLSETNLIDLNYIVSNGPSAEQSFTVKGLNLTSDISIAAPTNYEISTETGGSFLSTDPVVLTQSGGNVAETTIYVRLKSGLAAGDYNGEDITATSTDATNKTVTCNGTITTPALSVSESELTGFQYYFGNGPSVSQTFTVEGTNLTNNLVVSAPTNYEVSDDDATFGATVTLNPSSNEVATTTIYVRLKAGLSIGEYNSENITISSTDATSETLACSGDVILAPVTDLSVGCTTNTTAEISWTTPVGTYDGVVIAFRDDDSNPPHTISNGTDPTTITANAIFGSGLEFGSTTPNSYVVYKGTETSITVTGLTQGETYKVKAYTYSGTNWIDNSDSPTVTVSNLVVADVSLANNSDSDAQSELAWTNSDGSCFDEIMIVCRHSTSVTTTPIGDGTTYNANTIFASGTDIGTNEYVVYKGTGTSATVTELTNDEIYYAKIFVRSGTDWSAGVELVLHPAEITELNYGDLAIVAVNTGQSGGDEISFVCFKSIVTGTDIDFTDNGYERGSAGKWGDSEGTIRISRTGATVPAGSVVTIVGDDGGDSPELGTDFNIYIGGANDNANWSLSSLNGSSSFNMNSTDQIWIMQGGTWSNGSGSHEATYSGNVLYGWTAIEWKETPGTFDTKGSTIYPGCECATTNVIGLINEDKVKYNGPTDEANRIEWIGRINDPANWDDYAENDEYDASTPDYKNTGALFSIAAGDLTDGKWAGYKSADWCDCANWWNLRVPDNTTNVTIPDVTTNDPVISDVSETALCHDLTIEPDANLAFLENTELDIYGSLYVNTDISYIDASKGLIVFKSTDPENIKSNNVSWNDVKFDSPSIFTLNDNLQIQGTLNLSQGIISTDANLVHIQNEDEAAITAFGNSSYINGNLRRNVSGAASMNFPVGDASNYKLASVEITSGTLNHLDVHFASADLGETNISGLGLSIEGTPLVSVLDAGYWQVEPDASATNVIYNISINEKGASNAANLAEQHAVIKRDNAISDWELQGNHDNSTQSISGGVVTAKVSSLSEFSQFGIARSMSYVLAVELLNFNTFCTNTGIIAEWATASESNSDYFIIEYSSNGVAWKEIEYIPSFGTTNLNHDYQLLLENSPSVGYYRLSEMDLDGTKTTYPPVYINCLNKNNEAKFTISPNPAHNSTWISASNTESDFYLISIINMQGKNINTFAWERPNIQQKSLNTEALSPGLYSVKIYNETECHTLKLQVQ